MPRLSKITTRTGDDGTTGLADASRVHKYHSQIVALGDIDELNSHLGYLDTLCSEWQNSYHVSAKSADTKRMTDASSSVGESIRHWREFLFDTQNDLFDLGAVLSFPPDVYLREIDKQSNRQLLAPAQLLRLEQWVAKSNAELPPLREFVLPGGIAPAAYAHVCRSVCRRAERSVWQVFAEADTDAKVNALTQAVWLPGLYLNRLSDALFILTRRINQLAQHTEKQWQKFNRTSL